jgi:hypothetical protein
MDAWEREIVLEVPLHQIRVDRRVAETSASGSDDLQVEVQRNQGDKPEASPYLSVQLFADQLSGDKTYIIWSLRFYILN